MRARYRASFPSFMRVILKYRLIENVGNPLSFRVPFISVYPGYSNYAIVKVSNFIRKIRVTFAVALAIIVVCIRYFFKSASLR